MLEIFEFPAEPMPPKLAAILDRRSGFCEEVQASVSDILANVRDRGDEAVREYTRKFDGVEVEPGGFRVPSVELEEAAAQMDPKPTKALAEARDNGRRWLDQQREGSWCGEDTSEERREGKWCETRR